jgi:predicted secreted acid phosphatase
MIKLRASSALFAVAALLFGNAALSMNSDQVSVPAPPNDVGGEIGIQYSQTAQYRKEFRAAVAQAKKFCANYIAQNPHERNLCVVSDIDETVLDNRPHVRRVGNDQNWDKFEEWLKASEAPELKPTADFLKWARRHQIAVFFVTGRPESDRTPTIINLLRHQIGYDGLYFRTHHGKEPAEVYKTRVRTQIEDQGFKIIENIGDQYSDLAGGHSLDCQKLPNKMSFIP